MHCSESTGTIFVDVYIVSFSEYFPRALYIDYKKYFSHITWNHS